MIVLIKTYRVSDKIRFLYTIQIYVYSAYLVTKICGGQRKSERKKSESDHKEAIIISPYSAVHIKKKSFTFGYDYPYYLIKPYHYNQIS